MTPQLSLFGPEDRADTLARGLMWLAWACIQARGRLTEQGFAEMCGEIALAHQRLESVTNPQLAVPRIAEIRAVQRDRMRAAGQVRPHFPPVYFRDDRPAWAARTEGSEP